MSIYVFTANNYLFIGLKKSLECITSQSCYLVKQNDLNVTDILKSACQDDIFLLIPEGLKFSFRFLNAVNHSQAKVLYCLRHTSYAYHSYFGFSVLPKNFTLHELISSCRVRKNIKKTRPPQLTSQEKLILYYSIRGLSVNTIAKHLSLSCKTIYHHQLKAVNKIGVRKVRDLVNIPKDYIDFLHLNY